MTDDAATMAQPGPGRVLRDWRAPLLAAAVALAAGLPGLIAAPPFDRDEALFAQASAQMLESGDFVDIRYQDGSGAQAPPGANWLQAASAWLFSPPEKPKIWAYRLPALLGALLAAAASAWGAARFLGSEGGALAGAGLGASLLLSTEAGVADTGALACGAISLALAALGGLYGAWRGVGPPAGRKTKALFWLGMALAVLVAGPVGPLIAAAAGLALWLADRKAPWLRSLGWSWGLILIAALFGPWATAITVRTDGAFWGEALGRGLGRNLPALGAHTLLAPLMLFPMTAFLPAALVRGWNARGEPGTRFALAWLGPAWLMLELLPSKALAGPLPLYGALAWLIADAAARPVGRASGWIGAGLCSLAGAVIVTLVGWVQSHFGDLTSLGPALIGAALTSAAAAAGAFALRSRGRGVAIAAAIGLGIVAHGVLLAAWAPRLEALWLSRGVMRALDLAQLNPSAGLIPGPISVAGYDEPSLVFLSAGDVAFGDVGDAADAISDGRPALVDQSLEDDFESELEGNGLQAEAVGVIQGFDYAAWRPRRLILYRTAAAVPQSNVSAGPGPAPR